MNKSYISRIIFILVILYCVMSINVLFLAMGLLPQFAWAERNPYLLVWFCVSSFALALLVSAYHLTTMLRRKKRSTDRLAVEGTANITQA